MCPYVYYTVMRKSQDKRFWRHMIVISVEQYGIRETARRYGTTRNTVRKWYRRWIKDNRNYNSLQDHSHRPHRFPNAISGEEHEHIKKLKKKYKRLGADQIKVLEDVPVSARTMRKIWREEDFKSRKRRKKHETKQNLRKEKKEWKLFQQICEDTKDLYDIPEYYFVMKKNRLPVIQYTARDVTSGLLYMGFADERSLTYSELFAQYLNGHFKRCGVDLSHTVRQTDNGSEYIGAWNAKEASAYTKVIEGVKGQIHKTIFPGAHRYQSDVETVHNLVEMEFYEIEDFESRADFLNKAYSYQLFFNLVRPNTYKENQTPRQIASKKQPNLSIEVAKIPPVFLDDLFLKKFDYSSKVGYDVSSVP